jgi:hypothetical protein
MLTVATILRPDQTTPSKYTLAMFLQVIFAICTYETWFDTIIVVPRQDLSHPTKKNSHIGKETVTTSRPSYVNRILIYPNPNLYRCSPIHLPSQNSIKSQWNSKTRPGNVSELERFNSSSKKCEKLLKERVFRHICTSVRLRSSNQSLSLCPSSLCSTLMRSVSFSRNTQGNLSISNVEHWWRSSDR